MSDAEGSSRANHGAGAAEPMLSDPNFSRGYDLECISEADEADADDEEGEGEAIEEYCPCTCARWMFIVLRWSCTSRR